MQSISVYLNTKPNKPINQVDHTSNSESCILQSSSWSSKINLLTELNNTHEMLQVAPTLQVIG
jgi:hypothetical protein